jgi:hypothetical protein
MVLSPFHQPLISHSISLRSILMLSSFVFSIFYVEELLGIPLFVSALSELCVQFAVTCLISQASQPSVQIQIFSSDL